MPVINLPLRTTPKNTPYIDWTMPDWEDNGWNKAIRECAYRLNAAGIPVVLLEDVLPNAKPTGPGETNA
jgi:hypothetical protein